MIRIICENSTASVDANGPVSKLYTESLGLIVEGFRLIRRLNDTLYDKTKEDIFIAILDGKLDNCTEPSDNSEGTEVRIDFNEIMNQMKQEEGDN